MVRQWWWHVTCSMLSQLRCRAYSQVLANISYQLLASPPYLAMLLFMQQCEVACATFSLLVGLPCLAYAMHLPTLHVSAHTDCSYIVSVTVACQYYMYNVRMRCVNDVSVDV